MIHVKCINLPIRCSHPTSDRTGLRWPRYDSDEYYFRIDYYSSVGSKYRQQQNRFWNGHLRGLVGSSGSSEFERLRTYRPSYRILAWSMVGVAVILLLLVIILLLMLWIQRRRRSKSYNTNQQETKPHQLTTRSASSVY